MNPMRLTYRLRVATMALSLAMVACVAPASGVSESPGAPAQRLIVVTVSDWPALDALARRVAAVTGVAVVDVRAVAPRQFAFSLLCRDAAACQAARERLSAEPNFVLGVQDNQRRRLPTRPTPPGTQ